MFYVATRSKPGGRRYNTWNHTAAAGRWKESERSAVGILQFTYEEERGWKADVIDLVRMAALSFCLQIEGSTYHI
jgi:sarcosine oxidase delta subunit